MFYKSSYKVPKMEFINILLFALVAAIGNAMFAAGQKIASTQNNSLVFIAISGAICVALTIISSTFFGSSNYLSTIRQSWHWSILSGLGLFFTYLGFNILYSRYGAANYIVYAVLSVITTSVVVGVFIFKERFNIYHFCALLASIMTVFLYWLGNSVSKT